MKKKIINVVICILVGCFLILFPVISGVVVSVTKMESPSIQFLQAGFMYVPIIIALLLLMFNKLKENELMLLPASNKKDYLYYLPVILVYIPVLVQGFMWKGTAYFFGNLLLYLAVGIAEEIYFRGIIPALLEREFKQTGVIVISTLIFGLGHTATAFTETDPLMVFLTILNALIFGFMAICLRYKTKTIIPLMLVHFLFDFETKFIVLQGVGLGVAEGIRGAIMCVYAIVLLVLLLKDKKKEEINKEEPVEA